MDEAQSRRIAGLLGPTIIVMIVSEFPLLQPRLYDAQIPPVAPGPIPISEPQTCVRNRVGWAQNLRKIPTFTASHRGVT